MLAWLITRLHYYFCIGWTRIYGQFVAGEFCCGCRLCLGQHRNKPCWFPCLPLVNSLCGYPIGLGCWAFQQYHLVKACPLTNWLLTLINVITIPNAKTHEGEIRSFRRCVSRKAFSVTRIVTPLDNTATEVCQWQKFLCNEIEELSKPWVYFRPLLVWSCFLSPKTVTRLQQYPWPFWIHLSTSFFFFLIRGYCFEGRCTCFIRNWTPYTHEPQIECAVQCLAKLFITKQAVWQLCETVAYKASFGLVSACIELFW